jgi:hypothetical protein
VQSPSPATQVPARWQASIAGHETAPLPTQTPAASQVSVAVHGSPSSQAAPAGRGGFEHSPVRGSQVPAAKHGPAASQRFGRPPAQRPAWQVSPVVQGSPSLQATIPSTGARKHPTAGSQKSSVHGSPSSHASAAVPPHPPARSQRSPVVQASSSSQAVPAAASA